MLLIAPLSDASMFYIKYLTMHEVHMHAGTEARGLSSHTYAPYNNLYLFQALALIGWLRQYQSRLNINASPALLRT